MDGEIDDERLGVNGLFLTEKVVLTMKKKRKYLSSSSSGTNTPLHYLST